MGQDLCGAQAPGTSAASQRQLDRGIAAAGGGRMVAVAALIRLERGARSYLFDRF
jgi:hypothetical protein